MRSATVTPLLLLILDGFGHRLRGNDNAVLKAHTPFWNKLKKTYPYGTVLTSGEAVGLPKGQFGNSEVGHMSIGAGRLIKQDISRIDEAIEKNELAKNEQLIQAFELAKNHTLHVLALISDGGVHSHENHIHALIKVADRYSLQKMAIHAFLDGRDTPPKSANRYLERLQKVCVANPFAKIATLCGRYFAMDRDNRWDRTEKAYRLIVEGKASYHAHNIQQAIKEAYARGESDEFIQATLIAEPIKMKSHDVIIFMNFRADRAKQLTQAITERSFDSFKRRLPPLRQFITLTDYGKRLDLPCLYATENIQQNLGEYIASCGLPQLRIAETEKFAHVTYFFNGGNEKPYPKEKRILIPSPKVPTYDLQPEMSALKITDQLRLSIQSRQFAFIVCNFANGDMVGHSGSLEASVQAVQTIDKCLEKIIPCMLAFGGEILICADHGNCEKMYDSQTRQSHTQHTNNPSPLFYIGRPAKIKKGGALKDIAPSILAIMGLPQPLLMSGQSLIQWL